MNAAGLLAGSLDSPLTVTGRKQAKTAERATKGFTLKEEKICKNYFG